MHKQYHEARSSPGMSGQRKVKDKDENKAHKIGKKEDQRSLSIYVHVTFSRLRTYGDLYRISLEGLSAEVEAIDTELTELLSGPASAYAESVYYESLWTSSSTAGCTEVIKIALTGFNAMQTTISNLMDRILQVDGIGKEWQAVDRTNKRLKQVVGFLEDIYCSALLGTSELVNMHGRGELLFQC